MTNIFESDEIMPDADELFGKTSEPKSLEKVVFQPWHKPRKQWVRKNQWWYGLKGLLNDNKERYSSIQTIKYFGLTGPDLLDVEYLRSQFTSFTDADRKNLFLHGIINTETGKVAAEAQLSVLRDRDFMDMNSKVDNIHFDAFADKQSLFWNRLKSTGPYHIVNLDFCGCLFKEKNINAMHLLISDQIHRLGAVPWIFCVTTRIDEAGVHQTVFDRLRTVYDNLTSNEDEVIEKIEECFEELSVEDKSAMTEVQFSQFLQVCFVLWVVVFALSKHVKVKLTSAAKYRVCSSTECPDMLSLVFTFIQQDVVAPDLTGLAQPTACSMDLPLEVQTLCKTNAVNKLSNSCDVDEHLANNAEKLACYAKEMESLLQKCGWDTKNYMTEMCP